MNFHLTEQLIQHVPSFKVGLIQYENIVVSDIPDQLASRIELHRHTVELDLLDQPVTYYEGVREWRQVFKAIGVDPGKYRPSHEALFRRIKAKKPLPEISSAVSLNNFFSLQYELPLGLYDMETIHGDVTLTVGTSDESFDGLNGRVNSVDRKLITKDANGPFGSPVVDSVRTAISHETTSGLHVLYIPPSKSEDEAITFTKHIGDLFTQVHGGQAKTAILHREQPLAVIH
ncbi:hypothetical protein DH09_09010 [Bacillaceae bacterium JMAK1]|nr:hypothetical protein DH09_09010 [Bacillaceae bacterium JMAK1]